MITRGHCACWKELHGSDRRARRWRSRFKIGSAKYQRPVCPTGAEDGARTETAAPTCVFRKSHTEYSDAPCTHYTFSLGRGRPGVSPPALPWAAQTRFLRDYPGQRGEGRDGGRGGSPVCLQTGRWISGRACVQLTQKTATFSPPLPSPPLSVKPRVNPAQVGTGLTERGARTRTGTASGAALSSDSFLTGISPGRPAQKGQDNAE